MIIRDSEFKRLRPRANEDEHNFVAGFNERTARIVTSNPDFNELDQPFPSSRLCAADTLAYNGQVQSGPEIQRLAVEQRDTATLQTGELL